jgi:hypothetical protein
MTEPDDAHEHLRGSRLTAQRVRCPRCAAEPGENCLRANGQPRISNHIERVHKARQTIGNGLEEVLEGTSLMQTTEELTLASEKAPVSVRDLAGELGITFPQPTGELGARCRGESGGSS